MECFSENLPAMDLMSSRDDERTLRPSSSRQRASKAVSSSLRAVIPLIVSLLLSSNFLLRCLIFSTISDGVSSHPLNVTSDLNSKFITPPSVFLEHADRFTINITDINVSRRNQDRQRIKRSFYNSYRFSRQLSLPPAFDSGNTIEQLLLLQKSLHPPIATPKAELQPQNKQQQLAASLAQAVVTRLDDSESSGNVINSANVDSIWSFISHFDEKQRRNMLRTALDFIKKTFSANSKQNIVEAQSPAGEAITALSTNIQQQSTPSDAAASLTNPPSTAVEENADRTERSYGGGGGGYGGMMGGGCGGGGCGGCGGGGCGGGCCAQIAYSVGSNQNNGLSEALLLSMMNNNNGGGSGSGSSSSSTTNSILPLLALIIGALLASMMASG